jgi:hypothetical protein
MVDSLVDGDAWRETGRKKDSEKQARLADEPGSCI